MSQTWVENHEGPGGTTVKDGLQNLEDKLDSMRAFFGGTAFPTDDARVEGQFCWRSDVPGMYMLENRHATVPASDNWVLVFTDQELTAFGDSMRAAANAAAALTLLGVGTAGLLAAGVAGGEVRTNSQNESAFLQPSNDLSDVASAATARTNLGLGALSTMASVGTSEIGANAVTRAKLEVPEQSYTIVAQAGTSTANEMEYINATLGVSDSWQLDLPASPTTNAKVLVRVASVGAGSVLTIDGNGEDIGQTGTTTIKMYAVDEIIELQYNGTLWVFLQKNLKPHVCQISSANFTLPNSASWGTVLLDTVEVDTASMENVASNAIDVQRTGNYRVKVAAWMGQVGPAWHVFRVMKDAVRLTPQLAHESFADSYPGGEHDETLRGGQFDFVYSLTAGEQLKVEMYGTLDTSAENEVRLTIEEIM